VDVTLFALIGLGLAVGFGTATWLLLAFTEIRRRRWWQAFWLAQVGLANLVSATVIALRFGNQIVTLPRGVSTLLLIPIIVIPPAIHLVALRKAQHLTSPE
jgi:hypothetical protein